MPHKRINRIVFYLNDEEEGRLDKAVDESGMTTRRLPARSAG